MTAVWQDNVGQFIRPLGPECSPNGYDKHMPPCHTKGVYYGGVVCITIQLISVDGHAFL